MRITTTTILSLTLTLSATLLGCAAEEPSPSDGPVTEAPARPAESAPAEAIGVPAAKPDVVSSSVYPAPHPSMPQIPKNGGVVLHDPVIVTITFAGDPWESKLVSLGEQVGGLSWWSTVHDGYGVRQARSGGHVTIADQPASRISDAAVERWLASRIADGTLPAPTDQHIYTIYYPRSTTVTLNGEGGGASCQVFLGYHSTITVSSRGQAIPIAYAVINRCSDRVDDVTTTASHEFSEAATDPHPIDSTTCGFVTLTDNAWTGLGGENADMCAGVSGVSEGGFALTRVWNNVSAAAGYQPCLPAPDGGIPYFNAGVVQEEIALAPGGTAQIEVDCYSFGPLPAPMTLEPQAPLSSPLRFGFDRRSCSNGDKVTMTVNAASNAQRGGDYHYTLLSSVGKQASHLWRGIVHVQ